MNKLTLINIKKNIRIEIHSIMPENYKLLWKNNVM
jgi:hypothetical protein